MRLSRLHYPVRTLGYGVRAGIWTQGCSIGCRGCVSLDTWDPDAGQESEPRQIGAWLADLPGGVDGVTISGGEPSDQPGDLRDLLEEVRSVQAERGEQWDILLYSGRATPALLRRCPWIGHLVDVAVTGPYKADLPSDDPLMGSSNQRVEMFSSLGRDRYATPRPGRRGFDIAVDDGDVWMVGIPGRGDMERLTRMLQERGIELGGVSWRA